MIKILERELLKTLETLKYHEVLLDGEVFMELERICYDYNVLDLADFKTLDELYSLIYKSKSG